MSALVKRCVELIILQSKTTSKYSRHFKNYCRLVVQKDSADQQKPLEETNQDFSEVTPNFQKSFNIAAYVNRSETLQNLLHLNVNLNRIEKKPYYAEKFLKLDFERDMKTHIIFLSDYIGMDNIGAFITKNPMIFREDIDDIKVRINYLTSKGFTNNQIQRILENNPFWLMFSTVRIDRRLAYFQETFNLLGKEIRYLSTKQPHLITYNLHHIRTNTFIIEEEMGFKNNETKQLLLNKPRIWMLNQRALLERFNYVHNTMKISHEVILKNPELLLSRLFRIKQRHLFLEKMGRAQYDPKIENYVPVTALITNSDVEFCNKYTKCHIDDFNTFLKTL